MATKLDLLRLLLSLTQAKKLIWNKVEIDRFCAEMENQEFTVEFIHLMRTDEVGSDKTLARISAFGVIFDFCIGTEGFALICEIISAHDPQWREWNEICSARLADGVEWLRQQDTKQSRQ